MTATAAPARFSDDGLPHIDRWPNLQAILVDLLRGLHFLGPSVDFEVVEAEWLSVQPNMPRLRLTFDTKTLGGGAPRSFTFDLPPNPRNPALAIREALAAHLIPACLTYLQETRHDYLRPRRGPVPQPSHHSRP